jgi:membrane-bound lytic murein transglycosylase A
MQGISDWAKKNPQRVQTMLNANPRYVFFKVLESSTSSIEGPIGSMGVSLTAGRSIAVDWQAMPKGAPVYLSTTDPETGKPLERLVFAQDTGSAIVGGVRADYYWGSGDAAGDKAGKMKQSGRMWVILPKGLGE